MTNLVRSFIRQKNSLDEQLIAYILHDTLKVKLIVSVMFVI